MSLLIGLTAGLLGGLLYAITSYCLITPYMRHNVFAIAAFGVRGLLFSAFFLIFMSLLRKRDKQSLYSHSIFWYAMIGCASGFLSPVFDLVTTYFNFLDAGSGNSPPAMHATLLINLGLIALGYAVIGATIGIGLAYLHLAKKPNNGGIVARQ